MNKVVENNNKKLYKSKAFPQFNQEIVDFLKSRKEILDSCFANNSTSYYILPGFCDVHVHFREPGFSYKGTIKDGTKAAAAGGYTACCTMPNLNPVPDSIENLKLQQDIIKKDASIAVYPYAAITKDEKGKELVDMDLLAPDVIAFSDDGCGVQNDKMMREAMIKAKKLGKIVVAHCEVDELVKGGYIHDGEYAKKNNHKGICSASEYLQVERDIKLAKELGAAYHICHISTKETVELVRKAKAEGVDVTCETAPHYLVMTDMELQEEGRFKMNPPIRSKADRDALIEGVLDGTIDMIATDHAPHSAEEKSKGLEKSNFGIVGLETAFPLMYTHFVRTGKMTMEKLIELMVDNPRKRFNIPLGVDFSVWEVDKEYEIDSKNFMSKGKATPFEGWKVYGKCVATIYGGQRVW